MGTTTPQITHTGHWTPSLGCSPCLSSPFFFRPPHPGRLMVGPLGLLFTLSVTRFNQFSFYKHPRRLMYQHSLRFHVRCGRHFCITHFPSSSVERSHFSTNMPGPIRRTPSYKPSDFLKQEYRRPSTPEMTPDCSPTTPQSSSTPSGRPGHPCGTRHGLAHELSVEFLR